MRGQLRITSQRTPYMRAGLSWSVREPVEISIGKLTGEQFIELVRDPVIAMTISDDHGAFHALPDIAADIAADQAQMMIDAICNADPVGELLNIAATEVDNVGVQVRDLVERNQRQADDCLRLGDELNSARNELLVVRDRLAETRGQVTAAADREKDHLDRIKALETDLAAAKAKPKSIKPAPAAKPD